jgi:hypothetical protein
MLSEAGAACIVTVFFNCAFKYCNKRTPQYIQENCMTDFKLCDLNEEFFFAFGRCILHLAVSYSRLLTQHSLKGTSI